MPEVFKPISGWKTRGSRGPGLPRGVKGTRRNVVLLASFSLCAAPCTFVTAAGNDAGEERPVVRGSDIQPLLLMVDVNEQGLNHTTLVLKDAHGELYGSEKDLQGWRLRLPAVSSLVFRGVRYYPLLALPGIAVKLDEATMSMDIEARPETFTSTDFTASRGGYPAPTPPTPGMFFNYDLVAQRPGEGTNSSGLFELGAFNALGTGLTTFALQKGDGLPRSLRLDTSFTVDRPQRLASFRVGDAVSRPADVWGRAMRFGGVQYSTNFATQPGLITFPIQSFTGQAALPSTVDVYVNNVFATRRQVPPGPFSITDVPVVSGQGNVNIVVRDLLGREQAITQPFYASPSLLRKGLDDFSFESGALRKSYGIRSNDYGARFAAGTFRSGMTDSLTGEGHLQWQEGGSATLGLSALTLFPSLGTLTTSAAVSRSNTGTGRLWAAGFDRQSPHFGFGMRTQLASANFMQLGSLPGFPEPRRQTSVNMGVAAGRSGSIGMAYVRRDVPNGGRAEIASLSYSLSLQRAGLFGISAVKTLHGPENRSISVFWSMPIGVDVNLSATHIASRPGAEQLQVQAQRNLPSGDGVGYRVQTGRHVPHQGALLMQNRVGAYTLEAATFEGRSSVRAGMAGGVAVLGGSAFLSRRIVDSFGVVQVPGMEDVRVYVDNQLVARTDADGNALLPRLRAYDNNPVRVEHTDLRMDTEIRGITANPVPYSRTGVAVRFPIQRSYGALMKLVSDDGLPLPAGSMVEMEGQQARFPVAMDGAVYVTGLKEVNQLRASNGDKQCTTSVPFRESPNPVPNLGTFVCKAAQP